MLAFQSVYESYSAHIYNFIYSLLYNRLEAEDLTQEVFVRIWEKRDSLDIDKNFDSRRRKRRFLFALFLNFSHGVTPNRPIYPTA